MHTSMVQAHCSDKVPQRELKSSLVGWQQAIRHVLNRPTLHSAGYECRVGEGDHRQRHMAAPEGMLVPGSSRIAMGATVLPAPQPTVPVAFSSRMHAGLLSRTVRIAALSWPTLEMLSVLHPPARRELLRHTVFLEVVSLKRHCSQCMIQSHIARHGTGTVHTPVLLPRIV